MSLFAPAETTTAFLKMALMGFQGSGKSYTAALTAIGIAKLIKAPRPAFFLDTEKGSELVIESLAANNRHERIRLFRPFTDGQSARGGHGLGGRPIWSADGKYLLCWLASAEGQKQVYRVEIDSDREPELLPHQDGRFNADPTWSRDGRQIVFLSDQ